MNQFVCCWDLVSKEERKKYELPAALYLLKLAKSVRLRQKLRPQMQEGSCKDRLSF